jgi:hypothetical protein
MSNWLTRAFARITGRTPAEDKAADGLSKQLNTAANTNRKTTTSSGSKAPARKKQASGPGYGSSSRRSGSDDTSYLFWSTGTFDSGSSGSYDSGGSCGGDSGGGGGGCD